MSSDDYIFVVESPAECICAAAADDNLHRAYCPVAWGKIEYRVKRVVGAYWETEDDVIEAFSEETVPVFYDKGKALLRAHEMAEKDPTEYGVRTIRIDASILRGDGVVE